MKKTLANLPGILALIVAFGSVAYAGSYTPPPSPGYPSGNNNADAPINVGSSNQTKLGGILTLDGDLTVNDYLLAPSGIEVGTVTATSAPATGGIHASGDICTDAGGGKCLSSVGAGSDHFGGFYVVAYAGPANTSAVNPLTGKASCPSGYTAYLAGAVGGGVCDGDAVCSGGNLYFCTK